MIKSEEAARLLRSIADLSGASIHEERTEETLTIRITLTTSQDDHGPVSVPILRPFDRNRLYRVLHVEDTDRAGDLIHYYLRNRYDVDTARNAEEALRLAMTGRYDYVLMDMNLGSGMSGFDLTETLRKTDQYAKTPIIAITGYTAKQDIERCISVGCSAYLSKPFLKEDLLRVMHELENQIPEQPQ